MERDNPEAKLKIHKRQTLRYQLLLSACVVAAGTFARFVCAVPGTDMDPIDHSLFHLPSFIGMATSLSILLFAGIGSYAWLSDRRTVPLVFYGARCFLLPSVLAWLLHLVVSATRHVLGVDPQGEQIGDYMLGQGAISCCVAYFAAARKLYPKGTYTLVMCFGYVFVGFSSVLLFFAALLAVPGVTVTCVELAMVAAIWVLIFERETISEDVGEMAKLRYDGDLEALHKLY